MTNIHKSLNLLFLRAYGTALTDAVVATAAIKSQSIEYFDYRAVMERATKAACRVLTRSQGLLPSHERQEAFRLLRLVERKVQELDAVLAKPA